MRGPHIAAALAAASFLGGCLSDDAADSASASDEATQEKLLEAYATLEAAAGDVPDARLPPRVQGEVEVVEAGDDLTSAGRLPQRHLALIEYFGERGVTFGLALLKDGRDPGPALGAIEFTDSRETLELIVPSGLRRATAGDLVAGGATFAAISPSGRIYCIDAPDAVRSCEAPDPPEQ